MITTLRQPALPAASTARTVTELFPTRSGITADQAVVPEATPAVPKLEAQETSVTATLSLAMPAMMTEDAVVDMLPVEGVVMVKAGAVVSAPPPPKHFRFLFSISYKDKKSHVTFTSHRSC